MILEENAHIFTSETGGLAQVAGLMVKTLRGEDGAPEPWDVERAIRPENIHYPRTALIGLENTHYRYGGIVVPLSKFEKIREVADRHHLSIHLDGARLFNAAVYLGVEAKEIARYCDSVMISLSKGLGAPVGSLLAGSGDFIKEAERYRKMLGGGMRQTGWLCACGILALSKDNISRLREDHDNARFLAEGLQSLPGIEVNQHQVQTNFVLADLSQSQLKASVFLQRLRDGGILATQVDDFRVRFVTSREVEREDITVAIQVIKEVIYI